MIYIIIALALALCIVVWLGKTLLACKKELKELKKKQQGRREADEKIEQMHHGDALGNALDVLSNKTAK